MVGNTCFQERQIPVMPETMNTKPKNKKICGEKKAEHILCSVCEQSRFLKVCVYDTLCSQCKFSRSPKATWNNAKSCN